MPAAQKPLVPSNEYEAHLHAIFDEWIVYRATTGSRQRSEKALKPESALVYQEMWHAFSSHCVAHALRLENMRAQDISEFLAARIRSVMTAKRGRPEGELTPRYAWRMLMLIDRIIEFHAKKYSLNINTAAKTLLQEPEYRFANGADQDALPEYLRGADVARLIKFLTESPADSPQSLAANWKQLRDQTAVAVMLGAGLSPGDIRALPASGVNGKTLFENMTPSLLSVPGNGNSPERETPVAEWAGKQLAIWLEVRHAKRIPGPFAFPSTLGGKAWSHTGCYEACKAVLLAAGLEVKAGGVFRLRHTFALRQLANGAAESDVARWLGYLDPNSMARYRQLISSGLLR